MSNNIKSYMDGLRRAMEDDHAYAWSWHCTLAMASIDEGMPHDAANRAAARFMQTAFGVDTTKFDEYRALK